MTTYTLKLAGPAASGTRISGTLVRDLFDLLVDAVEQAVSLRVEGRSTGRGKPPAWLARAAQFHLVGIGAGSTEVRLEAEGLAEAAPERFGQLELFSELDPRESCLDLFSAALTDVVDGKRDSDLYDDRLLHTLEGFERVFQHGILQVDWVGNRMLRLDQERMERLRRLARSIPRDRAVVLAGKLDHLKHTERAFTLLVPDGTGVRGVLGDELDLEPLRELWGKPARVSGSAKFRPSGEVLRIEANVVRPAGEDEMALWSAVPRPLLEPEEPPGPVVRRPQGPSSGVAAIFGQWPGDESDEEIEAALRGLS